MREKCVSACNVCRCCNAGCETIVGSGKGFWLCDRGGMILQTAVLPKLVVLNDNIVSLYIEIEKFAECLSSLNLCSVEAKLCNTNRSIPYDSDHKTKYFTF
jgi:hypothetical protein